MIKWLVVFVLAVITLACDKELLRDKCLDAGGKWDTTHHSCITNADPLQEATIASQKGPEAVVSLLVSWDTAGKTLSYGIDPSHDQARDYLICWKPEENCETDEPGWDTATIIRGYNIGKPTVVADTTHVVVTYDVVGQSNGGEITRDSIPQRWDVRLRRVDGRWRVISPESQKAPSVSVATALREIARTKLDTMFLGEDIGIRH